MVGYLIVATGVAGRRQMTLSPHLPFRGAKYGKIANSYEILNKVGVKFVILLIKCETFNYKHVFRGLTISKGKKLNCN